MLDKPSFLVQVGFQGRKRVEKGIDGEYIDGAILSPADYVPNTTKNLANRLSDAELVTLFDPQLYLPGQGDKPNLDEYNYHAKFGGDDYYPGLFYNEDDREEFFTLLIDYQDELDCSAYLTPASYMSSISEDDVDDWVQISETFIEKIDRDGRDKPIYLSLPVNGKQINDAGVRSNLLNAATMLDADGFYVSVMYDDREVRLPLKGEINVKSYLDLLLQLKINRYDVIAAFTHQISHLLFSIGVDAIASGHFKNLRSFDVNRWVVPEEREPRQTVIRYYSDELLDTVRPDHLLNELEQNSDFDLSLLRNNSPFEADLFDSTVPIERAGWAKTDGAWEHYIWSCGNIAKQYRGKKTDERVSHARDKIRKGRAIYRKINSSIDEHLDELDGDIYDDWDNALSEIEGSKDYERLRRVID